MDELASVTDLAVVQRLLKRIQGKGRRKRTRHPPANNAAREGVDDKGHVGKAAPSRHIGQIRNPQGVRARRGEVPMNDIRRSLYSLVRPSRYHTPAAAWPLPCPSSSSVWLRCNALHRPLPGSIAATLSGYRKYQEHAIMSGFRQDKMSAFWARYRVRCGWLTCGGRDGLLGWAEQPGFAFLLQPVAFAFDVDGRGMVQEPVQDRGGQDPKVDGRSCRPEPFSENSC